MDNLIYFSEKFVFYMNNQCARAISPVISPYMCLKSIWRVEADATYDVRAFSRPAGEMVYIRTYEGSGELYFRNKPPLILNPGTLILFPHEKIQRYHCIKGNWKFWWFECGTDEKDVPLFVPLSIPIITGEEESFLLAFETLQKNKQTGNRFASSIVQSFISRALNHLQELGSQADPHQVSIELVIALMHENLTNLSVEEMAKTACMCQRRFRDVFRRITSKSPKDFYDALRLGIVENMLHITNMSLAEIAEKTGFSSQFHLSKAFKKRYGVSPKFYRA